VEPRQGKLTAPPALRAAAAWAVLGIAAVAAAGQPPLPSEPAEYYARVTIAATETPQLEVESWVQFAHFDSLDLVHRMPALARLQRVEARIGADGVVLNPWDPRGSIYRTLVARGAPLQWSYTVVLASADSLPRSTGPDHVCVWLAGLLLEPVRCGAPAERAVEKYAIDAQLPRPWKLVGPWRQPRDRSQPARSQDLFGEFAGWGAWRVRTSVRACAAGACTLAVAAIDSLPDSLGTTRETAIASVLGPGQCTLFVTPGATPRGFAGRHSALLRVPATGDTRAAIDTAWQRRRDLVRR